ncbi:hypothetical protein HY382_02455 [Candidatus Curtissbacteria bacterium]|nr:hypothetical protein [Candidatus Curtissbacteria bacterium]
MAKERTYKQKIPPRRTTPSREINGVNDRVQVEAIKQRHSNFKNFITNEDNWESLVKQNTFDL